MANVPSLNFLPFGWSCACLWPITAIPAWVPTPTGLPKAKTSAIPFTRCMAIEQSTCKYFVSVLISNMPPRSKKSAPPSTPKMEGGGEAQD